MRVEKRAHPPCIHECRRPQIDRHDLGIVLNDLVQKEPEGLLGVEVQLAHHSDDGPGDEADHPQASSHQLPTDVVDTTQPPARLTDDLSVQELRQSH
jgi:hypothetical protein